jgi:hypothetical protein
LSVLSLLAAFCPLGTACRIANFEKSGSLKPIICSLRAKAEKSPDNDYFGYFGDLAPKFKPDQSILREFIIGLWAIESWRRYQPHELVGPNVRALKATSIPDFAKGAIFDGRGNMA